MHSVTFISQPNIMIQSSQKVWSPCVGKVVCIQFSGGLRWMSLMGRKTIAARPVSIYSQLISVLSQLTSWVCDEKNYCYASRFGLGAKVGTSILLTNWFSMEKTAGELDRISRLFWLTRTERSTIFLYLLLTLPDITKSAVEKRRPKIGKTRLHWRIRNICNVPTTYYKSHTTFSQACFSYFWPPWIFISLDSWSWRHVHRQKIS